MNVIYWNWKCTYTLPLIYSNMKSNFNFRCKERLDMLIVFHIRLFLMSYDCGGINPGDTYIYRPISWSFFWRVFFFFFFSILPIFRWKGEVKVGPKAQISDPSLFHKNVNPSKIFKQYFCFLKSFGKTEPCLVEFRPKTFQKGLNCYAKLWKFITWQQQMLY